MAGKIGGVVVVLGAGVCGLAAGGTISGGFPLALFGFLLAVAGIGIAAAGAK